MHRTSILSRTILKRIFIYDKKNKKMERRDNLQSKEAATFSTANIRNISKCLSVQIGEQVTLPCRVQNKKGKQPIAKLFPQLPTSSGVTFLQLQYR